MKSTRNARIVEHANATAQKMQCLELLKSHVGIMRIFDKRPATWRQNDPLIEQHHPSSTPMDERLLCNRHPTSCWQLRERE